MIQLTKPDLRGNEAKYLAECIASGFVTHRGDFEARFERELSKLAGRSAIATSSGTGALYCALWSLGVQEGDEVILPDLTFAAPASVIKALGARPVLVDVRADNWCLDWSKVEAAITEKTRAIVTVDLYGERCGVERSISGKIPVVQDACEALGLVEPYGDYVCYSFYGNKIITTGEGGALVGEHIRLARMFRDGGFDARYFHRVAGLNFRMSNLQAAVGCAQLERLDEMLARREEVLAIYRSRLKGHGKWLFVARVGNPARVAARFAAGGVETRPVFYPLDGMPIFYQKGVFPNAWDAWKCGLCLPTGTHLTDEQVHWICDLIEKEQEHGAGNLFGSSERGRELAPS